MTFRPFGELYNSTKQKKFVMWKTFLWTRAESDCHFYIVPIILVDPERIGLSLSSLQMRRFTIKL